MAGGGPMIRAISQIDAINSSKGGVTPVHMAPSQLSQGAGYQSNYVPQQVSPLVQQMMMQRQMSQFNPYQQITGLPAALMQMQGQLNQPMLRGSMPTYQNPTLAYKPSDSNGR